MGFPVVKLGEVCSFVRGLTYSKSDEVEFSSNVVIRATNIDLETHKLDFNELRYISDSIQIKDDKKLKKDDILICTASGSKSHLGKVAIVGSELGMAFGGFMGALRVNPIKIMPQYLFTFLVSSEFKRHIESLSDGANINNLKFSQIENLELPLPPLKTQQQMVAKLDAIFTEIDKATAAAEANGKNTEALFESVLRQAYQIKDGLKTVELGNICYITGGGTPSKSNPNFYIGDIPWATVRDMNKDYLEETDFKISKEAVKESSTNIIPKNNVVIATRVGLGKVCILKQDTAINQDLRGVVPKNKKELDVNYLFFWFKSISKIIVDAGRGATVHGVTLPFIKSLQIPLPPIALQEEIVAKLDAISEEVKKSSKSYTDKISELVKLKQSILKHAFNGGLVKE